MTKQKIKEATISDDTQYDPNRCNNGGAYGFAVRYCYVGPDAYHAFHMTTAEFEFCSYCGSFNSGCCSAPEEITEKELWNRIQEAEKDPSSEIYSDVVLFENTNWLKDLKSEIVKDLDNIEESGIIKIGAFMGIQL